MTTYTVKTRNWNGSKYVFALLNLPMAARGDVRDDDYDVKFCLQTSSSLRAWATWVYFMALRPLSGGWTYIVRPGSELGDEYKAVY